MGEQRDAGRTVGLVAGAGLVLLGLWFMLRTIGLLPDWLVGLWGRAAGPVALIVVGIGVIVLSQRGGLTIRGPLPGTRLYKSRTDKWIDGVLGGLGHYLGIDPVILRLAFIVLALVGWGGAVIAYIIMAIVVPREPEVPTASTGV